MVTFDYINTNFEVRHQIWAVIVCVKELKFSENKDYMNDLRSHSWLIFCYKQQVFWSRGQTEIHTHTCVLSCKRDTVTNGSIVDVGGDNFEITTVNIYALKNLIIGRLLQFKFSLCQSGTPIHWYPHERRNMNSPKWKRWMWIYDFNILFQISITESTITK